MTRIYLSGPISGYPELNRPSFDAVEERLLAEGFNVFNPQTLPDPDEVDVQFWAHIGCLKESIWQYYMKLCIAEIPLCDEMRMLPRWQNSKGAVLEHHIAKALGMKISYEPVVEVPKW